MDSAVAMAWAKSQKWNIFPVWFSYDQKHLKEKECARWQCREFADHEIFEVTMDMSWCSSCLLRGRKEVKGTAYVPARNIIQLAYVGGIALEIKAKHIVGGWNVIDFGGYPDCRPLFLQEMQEVLQIGMEYQVRIRAPLILKTKKEIIQLGLTLNVPFEHTWSCYLGGDKPCHKCNSCLNRDKGFKEVGIPDPLEE
jgi:7-cyano-7-deazaguanine synthase